MKVTKSKKLILELLLYGFFILSYTATVLSIHKAWFVSSENNRLMLTFFVTVVIYFIISLKDSHFFLSGIIFTSLVFLLGLYNSITWGVDVPIALFLYVLAIVIAGITIHRAYAMIMTGAISLGLLVTAYLQQAEILQYTNTWQSNKPIVLDAFVISLFLSLIALISWLSNREIDMSLQKAEASEQALRKERDSLEEKVQERTKELRKAQIEKLQQLHRFADLGKLASGLIHDLVNPLTVVHMNLERLSESQLSDTTHDIRHTVKKALSGTKKIESYVESARKQIQQQDSKETFNIVDEINEVLELFSYRLKYHGIKAKVVSGNALTLCNNSVKFHQCVSNLVSNAIDALAEQPKDRRAITISAISTPHHIHVSIHDTGPGIPSQHLDSIFEPFFSTKEGSKKSGTGIGLPITKEIIENVFGGRMSVHSSSETGTIFTIVLPM